ncbi:MAG: DNA recombination protein RmuC, partial [Gammaproteobacteria bacterium]|nr:DNA recombination protein RmuC [Gammaproteobacteria bacterium]
MTILHNLDWLTVLITFIGGIALGGLAVFFHANRRLTGLEKDKAVLEAKLRSEEQLLEERERSLQAARHELSATFSTLAEQSLRMNADSFLKLAKEHLGQHQLQAKHDLQTKQTAIDSMVQPIQEGLQATRKEIEQMEKRRQHAFGDIERNLKSLNETQRVLHEQTHQLVGALKSHQVRGRWG